MQTSRKENVITDRMDWPTSIMKIKLALFGDDLQSKKIFEK
jgi:hypothetical protein